MLKKILVAFAVVVLLSAVWVFYQYQTTAQQANEQIEKDMHWLRTMYDKDAELNQGVFSDVAQQNKLFLQRLLVNQTINDKRQFVRHYHGLYIRDGKKSCLKTQVIYINRNAEVLNETWIETEEGCLP